MRFKVDYYDDLGIWHIKDVEFDEKESKMLRRIPVDARDQAVKLILGMECPKYTINFVEMLDD